MIRPDFHEVFDDLNDVVGSVLIVSGARALAHPGIHQFLLEIAGNTVVSDYAAHQSHHNC